MLEIPRRNRTAGPFRRVAKIMAELGWTAVRVRELTRGGYKEQVSWLLSRYANRRPPCTAEELETPARTALFAKLVLMAQLVPSRLQNADGRRQASNTGVTEFILLLRLYLLRDNQFKPFGCRPPVPCFVVAALGPAPLPIVKRTKSFKYPRSKSVAAM